MEIKESTRQFRSQLDESALKKKAVALLAKREYSRAQLTAKLSLQGDSDNVESVLNWLIENGLQCDARFAQMFVRSKALSGYGPVRIKQELKQKGVNEYHQTQAFEAIRDEVYWPDIVDKLISKKAKCHELEDLKTKQKVMGYLQRRGFSLDEIYSGFNRAKQYIDN